MSRFPNTVRACLLFDRASPLDLGALVQAFVAEQAEAGATFQPQSEQKLGQSYRLLGSNNVMVCVDYFDAPADAATFEPLLDSPLVQAFAPDARERIGRHVSHLVFQVSHGLMPPSPQAEELLAALNLSQGASLPEFSLRLDICARLAALAHRLGDASLVHWPRADHLLRGDMFAVLAQARLPSLLHVHFHPSDPRPGPDGKAWVELTTVGLSDFLGYEAHILPSPVPWTMAGLGAITFLACATAADGVPPADGATFAPADQSFTCRVRHIPPGARSGEIDGPVFQLEFLEYAKYGYRAEPGATVAPMHVAAPVQLAAPLQVTAPSQAGTPSQVATPAPAASAPPPPAPPASFEAEPAPPLPQPASGAAKNSLLEEQRQAAQRMMPAVIAMRQKLQAQDWNAAPQDKPADAGGSALRRLWKAGGR